MSDASPAPLAYTGPRRVLSGIQASGALHLGNYLGALKRFTQLQDGGAPWSCNSTKRFRAPR